MTASTHMQQGGGGYLRLGVPHPFLPPPPPPLRILPPPFPPLACRPPTCGSSMWLKHVWAVGSLSQCGPLRLMTRGGFRWARPLMGTLYIRYLA